MFCPPNIIARVYGGLGNQCFIYATARALADRIRGSLILDPTFLLIDKTYNRPFLLSEFNVRVDRIMMEPFFWELNLRRVHALLQPLLPWQITRWFFEKSPLRFQPEVASWHGQRRTITLDGYWQTERYFEDAAAALAADLLPHQFRKFETLPIAHAILASEQAVFLHIRSYREVPGRQDGSFALPLSYFRNAVDWMRREIPSAHFFVFSDDLDWAVNRFISSLNIPFTPVVPLAGAEGSPLFDFHLMSLCRHAIVANSSFSWWAAWLGEQRRRRENCSGLILRPMESFTNADYWPMRWPGVQYS